MTTRHRNPKKKMAPSLLKVAFTLVTAFQPIFSQFTFPASTQTCPNNSSLTGYTSIASLNSDMQMELNRIAAGGAVPTTPYNLILCPGTTFDTSTNILMPTLNNVNIVCGNGGPNMMCIFDGGNKNENVQIQNPSIQGYVLNSVNIEGVTFQNFNGRSVDLGASAPTTATFKDCTWQVKVSILLISSN